MSENVYVQEFKSEKDIIQQYSAPSDALEGATIHLAWYGYGNYCGDSLVIFTKEGKLYEVNGGHCSCYGLEGQWKPEETSWKALAMRDLANSDCEGDKEADVLLKKLVLENLGA